MLLVWPATDATARTGADMTYSESAEGLEITRARALQELRSHGQTDADVLDFDRDLGVHATYLASDVLAWLGY